MRYAALTHPTVYGPTDSLVTGPETLVFTIRKPFQGEAYERELIRGMPLPVLVKQPNRAIRESREAGVPRKTGPDDFGHGPSLAFIVAQADGHVLALFARGIAEEKTVLVVSLRKGRVTNQAGLAHRFDESRVRGLLIPGLAVIGRDGYHPAMCFIPS